MRSGFLLFIIFVVILPHPAFSQTLVTVRDVASTNQGSPVVFNVTDNDTDDVYGVNPATVDLDVSTADLNKSVTTAQGSYVVNDQGTVTFTPLAAYYGTALTTYTVQNHNSETSSPTQIQVNVNALPVAVDDNDATNENVIVLIDATGNDYDPDGNIVRSTLDLEPSTAGTQSATSNSSGDYTATDGRVRYQPATGFTGTASIEYTVNDNIGALSNRARVTVVVNNVNQSPQAANDAATTNEDAGVSINVLENDTDDSALDASTVDLNPSEAGIQPTRTVGAGTFTSNGAGVVSFSPVANFHGSTTISYTVNDNEGSTSNAATIAITVLSINDPPVANDDAASTAENDPVSFSLLANDSDVDGSLDPSTIDLDPVLVERQDFVVTSHGNFAVNGSGVVTFSPSFNFNGTVSINYTVNDHEGVMSNIARITVTVTEVNSGPVAADDNASTPENTRVVIDILANDYDPDGTIDRSTVDFDFTTPGIQNSKVLASGVFSADGNGNVTFTPALGFSGATSTKYRVSDNLGLPSNAATILVLVDFSNDPPFFDAIPNEYRHKNAVQKSITITGISPGASEDQNVVLTATSNNPALIPNPSIAYNGTAPTAQLTFKPVADQTGTAHITVKATDPYMAEFSRTFLVEVKDARITSTPITTASPGVLYEYKITATVLDAAYIDHAIAIVAVDKPSWVTLTSTGPFTATLSGTPPVGAEPRNVRLQLRDGGVVIDQQEFTIDINKPPIVSPITRTSAEDEIAQFAADHFVNAYEDVNGDPLAEIKFTVLPRHGQIKAGTASVAVGQVIPAASLATLSYIPHADYYGLDTAHYAASDGRSYSATDAPIRFTIQPVDDAPRITLETAPLQFDIGNEMAQYFTPLGTVTEPDGDNIVSAEIGFSGSNFRPENDVLEFTNTGRISGEYSREKGVLTLRGEASDDEYTEAIRSIRYSFVNVTKITLDPRSVYVILSDGDMVSEPVHRIIELVYTFIPLDIPNVFTPDGNGMNDFWRITEKDDVQQDLVKYSDAVIRIYTSRGQLLIEKIGFDNPWDGTISGKPAPVDTYFYTIDLRYGKIRYTGSLTLLREQ